jgi:hypothetical protein
VGVWGREGGNYWEAGIAVFLIKLLQEKVCNNDLGRNNVKEIEE